LLITADGGGSNGSRVRLWKLGLQRPADEIGLSIGPLARRPAARPSSRRWPSRSPGSRIPCARPGSWASPGYTSKVEVFERARLQAGTACRAAV